MLPFLIFLYFFDISDTYVGFCLYEEEEEEDKYLLISVGPTSDFWMISQDLFLGIQHIHVIWHDH